MAPVPEASDCDRFNCPFPGCTRSFAELWRLKVHYRAPVDGRGSGVERGHGIELPRCPKCSAELQPGRHHTLCTSGLVSNVRRRDRVKERECRAIRAVDMGENPCGEDSANGVHDQGGDDSAAAGGAKGPLKRPAPLRDARPRRSAGDSLAGHSDDEPSPSAAARPHRASSPLALGPSNRLSALEQLAAAALFESGGSEEEEEDNNRKRARRAGPGPIQIASAAAAGPAPAPVGFLAPALPQSLPPLRAGPAAPAPAGLIRPVAAQASCPPLYFVYQPTSDEAGAPSYPAPVTPPYGQIFATDAAQQLRYLFDQQQQHQGAGVAFFHAGGHQLQFQFQQGLANGLGPANNGSNGLMGYMPGTMPAFFVQ